MASEFIFIDKKIGQGDASRIRVILARIRASICRSLRINAMDRCVCVCVHQASIIVQPDQSNVGYFIFWFSTKLLSVQKSEEEREWLHRMFCDCLCVCG